MKKLTLLVELNYDDDIIHGCDEDGVEWFYNSVLFGKAKDSESLILHSNEMGDEVGEIKIVGIIFPR